MIPNHPTLFSLLLTDDRFFHARNVALSLKRHIRRFYLQDIGTFSCRVEIGKNGADPVIKIQYENYSRKFSEIKTWEGVPIEHLQK